MKVIVLSPLRFNGQHFAVGALADLPPEIAEPRLKRMQPTLRLPTEAELGSKVLDVAPEAPPPPSVLAVQSTAPRPSKRGRSKRAANK